MATTGIFNQLQVFDPIASELMSTQLYSILSLHVNINEIEDGVYCLISAIKSKQRSKMSAEQMSQNLDIGLKTATGTLKETTHQCIHSKGLPAKRLRTNKDQLRYKQFRSNTVPFITPVT